MARLIAAIKPAGRRSRLRAIELDDGQTILLSGKAIDEAGLEAGDEVEEAALGELVEREEGSRALALSLRSLAQRPRSEAEIRQKLSQMQFSKSATDGAVARLSELGLIDDRRFAEQWVEERLRLRPRGRRMLRQELLAKGIASELVEDALSRDLAEEQNAAAIAEKAMRRMRSLDSRVARRRLAAALARRGYSYEVAGHAIRQVMAEEDDSEDDPPAG